MATFDQNDLGAGIREVLKRSAVDPEFRQLAVSNGPKALAAVDPSLSGVMDVTFIDNFNRTHKTVVLPDPVPDADSLSEEELEQVAGGCGVSTCGTSKVAED